MRRDPETQRRIERIAKYLDEAFEIPGIGVRVGWDGILGLLPGIGDGLSVGFSLWIVFEALRAGVPFSVAARMLGNVALDSLIGMVPALGDLFDFFWKANTKNARLLQEYLGSPAQVKRRSTAWLWGFALVALTVAAAWCWILFQIAQWLWGLLSGAFSTIF